jgi:hypothetical protein
MNHHLLKLLILAFAACSLAKSAWAEDIFTITTTRADPYASCRLLSKNLPHNMREIRAVAKLQMDNVVSSCAEYIGEAPEKCIAHLLSS